MVSVASKMEASIMSGAPEFTVAESVPSERIPTFGELDRMTEGALDRLEGLVGSRVLSLMIANQNERPNISGKGVDLIVDGEGRFVMIPGTRTLIFLGEEEDEIRENVLGFLKEKVGSGTDKPFGQKLLESEERGMLVPQRLRVNVDHYHQKGEDRFDKKDEELEHENSGFGIEKVPGVNKKTLNQMAGLVKAAVSKGLQYPDLENENTLLPWTKMEIEFGKDAKLILFAGGTEDADFWNKKTGTKGFGGKAVIILSKKGNEPERVDINSQAFRELPQGDQIIESLYHTFYGDNPNPETLRQEVADLSGQSSQINETFLKYDVSGAPGKMDRETFAKQLETMVGLTGSKGSIAEIMTDWDYGKPSMVDALNKVTSWVGKGITERGPVRYGEKGNRALMVETLLFDSERTPQGDGWRRVSPKFLPLAISPNLVIVEDVEPGRATQGNIVVIKKINGGWSPISYKPNQKDDMAIYAGFQEQV